MVESRHTVDAAREASKKKCVEPMSYLDALTGCRRSSSDEKESSRHKPGLVTNSEDVQTRKNSEDKDDTVLVQEDEKDLLRKEVPLNMNNVNLLTTQNSNYEKTSHLDVTSRKTSHLAVTYLDALIGESTQDCRGTPRKKLSQDSGVGDDLVEVNSEQEDLNIQEFGDKEGNKILDTSCTDALTGGKDEGDAVFIEGDELQGKKSPINMSDTNTTIEHNAKDEKVTEVQIKEEPLPRRYIDVLIRGCSPDETGSSDEKSPMIKSSLAVSYVDALTEQSSQEYQDFSNHEDEVELWRKEAVTEQRCKDETGSVEELQKNETFLDIPDNTVIGSSSKHEEIVTILKEEMTKIKPRHYTSYVDALIGRFSQGEDETVTIHDDMESLHTKSLFVSNGDNSTGFDTKEGKCESNNISLEASSMDGVTTHMSQDEDESVFSAVDEPHRIESSPDILVNTTTEEIVTIHMEEKLTRKSSRSPNSYVDTLIGRNSRNEDDTAVIYNDEESLYNKPSIFMSDVEDSTVQEEGMELLRKEIPVSRDVIVPTGSRCEDKYEEEEEEESQEKSPLPINCANDQTGQRSLDVDNKLEENLLGVSNANGRTGQHSQDEELITNQDKVEKLSKKMSVFAMSYVDALTGDGESVSIETSQVECTKKKSLPRSYASAVTGQKHLEDKESVSIQISSHFRHEETNGRNEERYLDDKESVTIPTFFVSGPESENASNKQRRLDDKDKDTMPASQGQEEFHLPLVIEIPGSRIISNCIENDPQVLMRRDKQILYGKNTESYKKYVEMVDKDKRLPGMPQTPNVKWKLHRRQWDGLVRNWKRRIHFTVSELSLDETQQDRRTSGSGSGLNWAEIMEEEDRLKEREKGGEVEG